MTRVLILLGITALACRDKESPKPATPGSAATATPVAPTAPHAARADKAPELLASFGSDIGGANVAERFNNEDVDTAWKSRTEADIKKRLVGLPPVATECKSSVCRLTITGSESDLSATVDQLQGLHDAAQSMVLSRPEPTKIVAYLTYERAD